MVDKNKIIELLKGDVPEQGIAVAMMRNSCSLGQSVEIIEDIGTGRVIPHILPSRFKMTIILSIYAVPWSMRKSAGVKGIYWDEILTWAARSPRKRPARNEFGQKICRQNVLDYFKDSYGKPQPIPINWWRITGLRDE